ncbi:MAG TPA: four helix bundle protein [Bacteroidales bacterium]|nr:four helix bundle protein [Bacteroidales bacterium]
MKQVIIKDKTFEFAVQIVELYKRLHDTKKEYVLGKQLLRSGTSIGANTREALNAESKADFIHKLAIAQKECDETIYWLELLKESNFISSAEFDSYNSKATEILKILRSIILTTKQNLITHNS